MTPETRRMGDRDCCHGAEMTPSTIRLGWRGVGSWGQKIASGGGFGIRWERRLAVNGSEVESGGSRVM